MRNVAFLQSVISDFRVLNGAAERDVKDHQMTWHHLGFQHFISLGASVP